MQVKYRTVAKDGKVIEEQYFEDICCEDMRMALLGQETPFAKQDSICQWLYCPFCKKEIKYC